MIDDLKSYWKIYGGIRALFASPFLWLAVVLTATSEPWLCRMGEWSSTALSILPSLLGFTIGAMAIVLAFPTTRIFRILAEDGRVDSYYAQLAAKLMHFVLTQSLALVLTLVYKAHKSPYTATFGYFFLCYALLTSIAIGLALFNVAQLYNEAGPLHRGDD